jgi:beta-carotene ketolase (CrtO type)
MADLTFDAVIIGGGNKGLLLAMYLMKYGGMSVGIFERRHEIGGCLATEETSAPGFRGNTHANIILPMYYMSLWRDFPEFWEYGGRWDQHLCSDGFVFRNNKTALGIYSQKYDPDQTKTAAQIARFSKKDAERWIKSAAMENSREYWRAQADMLYNPAEYKIDPAIAPGIATRQIEFFPKMMEAGYIPDGLILTTSSKHVIKEWFESPELQSCILRFAVSSVNDINDALYGPTAMGFATYLPLIGFCPGGTHQIAHACHQILTQLGCKFYTHAEVDKVIIENGAATGVKLMNGSQVKANKFVVSAGMAPHQVCFDLIGREYIDPILAKRVEMIEKSFGCLMWYTFAVHQAPKYDAEEFFPDIHECEWLGMQPDPDPDHIARECQYMKLGMWPPFEDYAPTVGCHSLADPSYAPPGKHVVQNEQLAPPATKHTEKEWLEIKERYADELIQIWKQYAPNMTWDNVIGVDTNSPYDHLRMKNLAPMGTMAGIDRNPWQLEGNRPTPELANHRTPIKNLYATGGCWWVGSNAGASESYNCYKIIAKDHNLAKPWEESDKKEPDSLVDQVFAAKKRLRDWGAAHPKKYGK